MSCQQSPSAVIMVRPAVFYSNPETAADNAFQTAVGMDQGDLLLKAQEEFDNFVSILRDTVKLSLDSLLSRLDGANVEVTVLQDVAQPPKPDAIFPNNWFTTHADGTFVIYPMLAPTRRLERRLLNRLLAQLQWLGYNVKRSVDFSRLEETGSFLEGTGALVFDSPNRVVYVALSQRATSEGLAQWGSRFPDYEVVSFSALDARDVPIYHTNVMLTVGTDFALVCLDSVKDEEDKARLQTKLMDTGKEIIPLSLSQVDNFAGNAFELRGCDGVHRLVLSETAFASLTEPQLAILGKYVEVVPVPLTTIEISGGSARCMLAANFLPLAS
ncbi:hypothetical protein FOZ60_015372 [Perkinsus olseni]|uniref:Amidinotransferase n=1 Tax=Perkinsus olseni TaxID=32597 RepID=A0A7J6P6Y6_PEROL|nr:hypothetical protein FOZ60_015372 [Perkinsus olseni]